MQAGQYWKATKDIPEQGIEKGTTLLIQSIRWVDDVEHTIILRPHPSKFGHGEYLELPGENGEINQVYYRYNEHRFLVEDFLKAFEFEPDHEKIRGDEVKAVNEKVEALQKELFDTQANPQLLTPIIEEKLKEDGEVLGPTGLEDRKLLLGTVSEAMQTGITSDTVERMKLVAKREHKIATIKAEWLKEKISEIGDTIKEITPYLEEKIAATLAQTEDTRERIGKMMEGIESLDLYVGKDVHVNTIRKGESAPKDVPLTMVQKKLFMDEELAVWTDVSKWFDFKDEKKFFEALRKHDGLVNQIFPTQRCVLVMATNRRLIDYGDSLANVVYNEKNRVVFLLIRDGWNIHQVFSSVESHLGASQLFPTKDDQDGIFRGFDGQEIKFADVAYTDKLKNHEAFALHYKRFLILACGLDHRLKLFGDFYPGPPSFGFVSMKFQEEHCRFLHDDDPSRMLPGHVPYPPVGEWIKEKNTYLRPGSRVLCQWNEVMNPTTAPGACRPYPSHDRREHGFNWVYRPSEAMSFAIATKTGNSVYVTVKASTNSWRRGQERVINCKVSLTDYRRGEWEYEDLPYLCLDAVEPEELHWYIHSRDDRRNHLEYIRFFKMALKFLEDEKKKQAKSKKELLKALEAGCIGNPETRPAIISQAVMAWRAANGGQLLPEPNAENWNSLLDQMYMLAGQGQQQAARIAECARRIGLTPLRLVLSGKAELVVYAAPTEDEIDDRLEPFAWVHRIVMHRGREKSRTWALLSEHVAAETTIQQWPEAEGWSRKTLFNSPKAKKELLDSIPLWIGWTPTRSSNHSSPTSLRPGASWRIESRRSWVS